MNYGLEEIKKDIQDLLGKKELPFIYYQENSSWREHLPKYENQTTKLGEETSGCTVWGWQNALEIFEKGVYGVEPNYSERFTYLKAGINPKKGKDPSLTLEAILEHGLVDDKEMPMTRTLAEFLDKSDLTGSLLAKGQNWLIKNELLVEELWNKHTGVRPTNYKEITKENLKRSPVLASVSAWNQVNGVYVSDQGGVNNHFCVIFEMFDYKQYKDCFVVFDTYDHSIKILHPDHNIRRAYAFWLNKKTPRALRKHKSILEIILDKLMQKKTLLSVAESQLGKDVTPKDTVEDSVACVDVLTTIMRMYDPTVPHMVSTIVLNDWLPKNGYALVSDPQEGDIIVSPTSGKKVGHCGLLFEDGLIASNNSFGINAGKFTKNYTLASWNRYYKEKLGLPVYIYRKMV